jgi:stage IV sporulation protein FB
MLFFQEPPVTRYDLRFSVAGIPVRVHPLFWLIALLFGYSGDLLSVLVWVVVVFVSILAHELGHAFAMRLFGRPSRVVLYLGGGLTVPESVSWGYRWADVSLSVNQEVLVSLAGPCTGFLVAGLVLAGVIAAGGSVIVIMLFGLLPFPQAVLPGGGFANLVVWTLLWVNIFWGLINLAPVIPLDGGNVARYLWLKADPWDGVNKSMRLSVIAGAVLAVAGLALMHSMYVTILFGLLAFQSYQMLKGRPSW